MATVEMWPGAAPMPGWDTPPADLLAAWLPELVDRHGKVSAAITAAAEAGMSFHASLPSPVGADGADWTAARRADVDAVRAGRKADKLAKLIVERPHRYGLSVATATVAAGLVAEWNRTAHEDVTRESRKRLVDEEANLRGQIAEHAMTAVTAAMESRATADDSKLRAAWQPVSALDASADAWRPVYRVLGWVSYQRPVPKGRAWEPPDATLWPDPLDEEGRPTLLGQAVALRDSGLRARFEQLRPPPVRAGSTW